MKDHAGAHCTTVMKGVLPAGVPDVRAVETSVDGITDLPTG